MKFENVSVCNFENAIRGMRNPKNSWAKSDSYFGLEEMEYCDASYEVGKAWARSEIAKGDSRDFEEIAEEKDIWLSEQGILKSLRDIAEVAFIGPNDMKLMQQLIRAGSEHRKFMRQIFVSVDITAPFFW